MSHFAKLDENNLVTFVTVGRQEDDGLEEELNARTGDVYRQTSYNTRGVSTTPMESQAKTSPKRSGSTMRASGIRTMKTVTLSSRQPLTLHGYSMRQPVNGLHLSPTLLRVCTLGMKKLVTG